MKAIDKVTIIDTGNGQGDGVNRLSTNVTKLMAQLPKMLKDVSGLDMNKMISGFMQGNKTNEQSVVPE